MLGSFFIPLTKTAITVQSLSSYFLYHQVPEFYLKSFVHEAGSGPNSMRCPKMASLTVAQPAAEQVATRVDPIPAAVTMGTCPRGS